jgi:hypothetical protein
MHGISSKPAEALAGRLETALKLLARLGNIAPATILFEVPDALDALRSVGVADGSAEMLLSEAIERAVAALPPPDREAAQILFGLDPALNGHRIGARRELAAAALEVSAGTFRNRHESRLIEGLSRTIAAALLPSLSARTPMRAASEEALGFWSYVHDDDAGDGGRILSLSEDLRSQYKMRTAEDLVLFVDRESSRWGEKWTQLISDAIAGTTFFIPIITPSYFRSNSCRQELLKFVREADRAGLQKLLMPVYWITVPALETEGVDANDEAIAAVARHQWRDLRDVRLEDRDSSPYRKAVSGLSEEIAERASEVAATVEDVSSSGQLAADDSVEGDEDAPGFLELLAEGDEAMAALTEVMSGFGEDIELIGGLGSRAAEQLQKAAAAGQGTKRALVITEGFAHELSPSAARMEKRGTEFARLLLLLDSGIQARLNLFDEQDEQLADEQIKYLREIEELASNADEALDALEELVESIDPIAEMSRSLRAPVRQMRAGLQGILDGRALMAEWGSRARSIRGT